MKNYTIKLLAWLLLTALLSILFILRFKLYACCQSIQEVRHGFPSVLVHVSLAIALAAFVISKWDGIAWQVKSFFYKRQKIS